MAKGATGSAASQPWGAVSNQWAGHTGCEYCGVKEGYLHLPSCPESQNPFLSAAPDNAWDDVDEGTFGLRGVQVKAGYHELFDVLCDALDQAQNGKGSERHGNGQPFTGQPVLTITRAVGRGFPLGQAMKKIQESQRMEDDAAKRELLGAINYLAAAILSFDE